MRKKKKEGYMIKNIAQKKKHKNNFFVAGGLSLGKISKNILM